MDFLKEIVKHSVQMTLIKTKTQKQVLVEIQKN